MRFSMVSRSSTWLLLFRRSRPVWTINSRCPRWRAPTVSPVTRKFAKRKSAIYQRSSGLFSVVPDRSNCVRSSQLDLLDPPAAEPARNVWFRVPGTLPDDIAVQQSVLAYMSDMTLLDTSTNPHAINFLNPKMQAASLDHAMWFHPAVPRRPVVALFTGQPLGIGGAGILPWQYIRHNRPAGGLCRSRRSDSRARVNALEHVMHR